MNAIVSTHKNLIYHRDYTHDWNPNGKAGRALLAALPFLCINKTFRFPVSAVLNVCRVLRSLSGVQGNRMVQASLAVSALITTFVRDPMGPVMTTVQDVVIEGCSIERGQRAATVKSVLMIMNHIFSLALQKRGGMKLSLATLGIQVVTSLVKVVDDFKKRRLIECSANLLMVAYRSNQIYTQYQQLERTREIEAANKRTYVGELAGKWQFPSDHVPVGIEVNGLKIISWNVFNNAYMSWAVDKNNQGLKGSMITELNTAVDPSGLTQRDLKVVEYVLEMLPRGQMIALQECSLPFIKALTEKLPPHWELVKSFEEGKVDQGVVLYDTNSLQLNARTANEHLYTFEVSKWIQFLQFSDKKDKSLYVVNAHLPGKPEIPAGDIFARYVSGKARKLITMVALGDYNRERTEVIEAFQRAGFDDFSLHTPYKTNIEPDNLAAKGIDHIFVCGPEDSRDLRPSEIRHDLQNTIDLLN